RRRARIAALERVGLARRRPATPARDRAEAAARDAPREEAAGRHGALNGVVVAELAPDAAGHGFDAYVERPPAGPLLPPTPRPVLVRRHFRHRPRCLEARRDGRIVGVLPLFQTRSPLAGRALVSMPYAVYGGPLVDDGDVEQALLARLRELV